MIRYLLKRFLLTLPVLFGVSTITFFLIHFVPGDPVDTMLGPNAAYEDRARLRSDLGLDQPITQQYSKFLSGLISFELGKSLISKKEVSLEIFERVPATLELTFAALFWAIIIGIPLGVLTAVKRNSKTDRILLTGSLLGISLPSFWLGPMLILVFSIQLDWLPVSEREGFESLVLPSLSLGIALSAVLLRMTRASLLEVIKEDYIRTARAKGASQLSVYFKHALRNALMPIITILGLQFGALLTGTVLTETIFDWPGVGTLFFQSIQQRNYPLIQGCVLFISLTYVLVNFLTDVAYSLANPKVRLS